MTVQRSQSIVLPYDDHTIREALRYVVSQSPVLRNFHDNNDGTINLVVSPGGMMLSTQIKVHLSKEDKGTLVNAVTSSQAYIKGDSFNYYEKYLNALLQKLSLHLANQPLPKDTIIDRHTSPTILQWLKIFWPLKLIMLIFLLLRYLQ